MITTSPSGQLNICIQPIALTRGSHLVEGLARNPKETYAWALQLTKTKYLIRRSVAPPPSTPDADPPNMTPKVPRPSKVDRGLLAHIKRCIQSPTFCSSNTAFAILDSKKKLEKGNIFSKWIFKKCLTLATFIMVSKWKSVYHSDSKYYADIIVTYFD